MLRKKVIALLAVAAVGLAASPMALAHNGGGGGGGRGAGPGKGGGPGPVVGGFRDGGFRDGGFHDRDFEHHRSGWSYGFSPYSYYDNYAYYDNDSCSIVQRRVYTTHGWRTRPVSVC